MSDVTWKRGDPGLSAFGRDIEVSNFVRLNHDQSVVRTTYGVPYKPQPFPAGQWRIIGVAPQTGHLAPFAILTDAWQMVEEWALTKDGQYDHPAGNMVLDGHYWIHYSDLDFTWGCIRVVHEGDLRWMATKTVDTLKEIRAITKAAPWVSFDVLEA